VSTTASSVLPAVVKPTPPARRRSLRPRFALWLFVTPAPVLYVAFLLIPILYAVYLSFIELKVTGGGVFGTPSRSSSDSPTTSPRLLIRSCSPRWDDWPTSGSSPYRSPSDLLSHSLCCSTCPESGSSDSHEPRSSFLTQFPA